MIGNSRAFALALAAAALFAAAPRTSRAAAAVTAEEATAGWISLFDGESTFGFNQLGDAQWAVGGGVLFCESGSAGWAATTSRFGDFELSAKIRVRGGTNAALAVRAGLEGHWTENGTVVIPIEEASKKGAETAWHDIKVTAAGRDVKWTFDGAESATVQAVRGAGYIGVYFFGTNFSNKVMSRVEVAELKLRPLNLKPIFNGKDLTEWEIIPNRKSVFSVVDGAINIKNGNGQIESKGEYKDFTLQLDIISNGDRLNSGVFYRGPKGVFWKGYESQVRNHWDKDDRTKPVDYGTGGNYGNQPTRKVVSTDREWFRKTIVCDGNHTSVWINGYQTSDFTDLRMPSPEKDGKTGYVPGPGTIHLQGHDPTTDLSFKNINIQSYE